MAPLHAKLPMLLVAIAINLMCLSVVPRAGATRQLLQAPESLEGELHAVIMHDGPSHKMFYSVRRADKVEIAINLPTSFTSQNRDKLITGAHIKLSGKGGQHASKKFQEFNASTATVSPTPQPLSVQAATLGSTSGTTAALTTSVTASALPGTSLLGGTALSTVRALFMVLNICGSGYAVADADIRNVLFSDAATSPTADSIFSSCSYGLTTLTSSSSRIAFLDLGCGGNNGGFSWTPTGCAFNDWAGMAYAAEQAFLDAGNTVETRDSYRHLSYILPRTITSCSSISWAEQGCAGPQCRSWFTGAWALNPNLYTHELGHNLNLMHASKGTSEYGDDSCAMGACCAVRCFNQPHMLQLGWAGVLSGGEVTGTSLPQYQTQVFTVPAAHTTQLHMLKVTSTWSTTTSVYYIGYRSSTSRGGFSGDSGLRSTFANVVNVYRYNGNGGFTYHLASLALNALYRDTTTGLVVRVTSVTSGTSAKVTLCRTNPQFRTETGSQCRNGIDDDCDGLIDSLDPDCKKTSG